MVTPRQIKFPEVKSEAIIMDGGLNESVSTIEMKPGELITCKNYYITEGSSGGYVSIAGYERYDGQTKPSSVDADENDYAAREAARSAILEVPGEGSVLGIHVFENKIYAFRNKAGGASAGMYVASPVGWSEIDTSTAPLEPDGDYQFINYNFLANSDSAVMVWVDSKNKARMYNGTLITVINNAGMGVEDTPNYLAVFGDRLFLAYNGGSLQYSNTGDPTDWGAGAGEIGIGYEITALDSSVGGTLVVFCEESIKVLKGTIASEWVIESFSNTVGAYPNTLQKIFDTLIFVNDFGVTTLSAAQDFGDFASNSISEKVKTSLLKYRKQITVSVASRSLNQYRLFFSDGKGLVFSFLNKKIRGTTVIKYPIAVRCTATGDGPDGNPMILFSSADGYVYQMDSGTSFDGITIDTQLATTYYHYKSPRYWKRFHRLTFEIASVSPLTFNIKPSYDYTSSGFAKGVVRTLTAPGPGGIWGEGEWGTMTWAGSETTNRIFYDILGIGSNLSLNLSVSSKFALQHTIQNFITDYILMGRQL